MIPALDAILIEALEPRQNRKRGDDLSAVEFIQREDPESQGGAGVWGLGLVSSQLKRGKLR